MLYTVNSDNPEDCNNDPDKCKFIPHFTINPYQYHEFLILILPWNNTHVLYGIWWDNQKIRTGYSVIDAACQVDEVHETFAGSKTSFSSCDHSYFKKSTLYTPSCGEVTTV